MKGTAFTAYKRKNKPNRRNKKDYFRGALQRQLMKNTYAGPSFTFNYLLLFSILGTLIIAYTPVTMLLGRLNGILNIDPFYSFLSTNIATIRLPHISTQRVAQQLFAPLTYVGTVTAVWLGTALQKLFIFLVTVLNPVPGVQDSAIVVTVSGAWIVTVMTQGSLWLVETAKDYFLLLGTMLSLSISYVLHAFIVIATIAGHILVFIITGTIRTLTSSFFIVVQTIETIGTAIGNGFRIILLFLVYILVALSTVIGQLLVVIKHYLDSLFAMISSFIHQFDPEYNFLSSSVGSSINELFSTMRQLFSNSPRFFKPEGF